MALPSLWTDGGLMEYDICDFVDGSGITECPDCGEIVEMDFDEIDYIDKCPYCYNGKYMYGD